MYIYNFKMKEIRKTKGITQESLAKSIGSSQAKISNYERGEIPPTLDKLVEIAAALDVSLDELVEMKQIHSNYSKKLHNNKK